MAAQCVMKWGNTLLCMSAWKMKFLSINRFPDLSTRHDLVRHLRGYWSNPVIG